MSCRGRMAPASRPARTCNSVGVRWPGPGPEPASPSEWEGDVCSWCCAACVHRNGLLQLAVRGSWLSSVTPRFLAAWVGAASELSKVTGRSWVGESFPGRKSSSLLSRLIFRWCAEIHWEMSVRQAEIRAVSCVSDWGKERISWVSSA